MRRVLVRKLVPTRERARLGTLQFGQRGNTLKSSDGRLDARTKMTKGLREESCKVGNVARQYLGDPRNKFQSKSQILISHVAQE